MLHRLLACLAFLTGLAAAGAPAHAEVAAALSSHLEVSAKAIASERREAAAAREALTGRFENTRAVFTRPALERIGAPASVYIGSDRSRE